MAKLYEFQSETELIELLGQNKTQLIAKKYFSAQASSIEQIVKEWIYPDFADTFMMWKLEGKSDEQWEQKSGTVRRGVSATDGRIGRKRA